MHTIIFFPMRKEWHKISHLICNDKVTRWKLRRQMAGGKGTMSPLSASRVLPKLLFQSTPLHQTKGLELPRERQLCEHSSLSLDSKYILHSATVILYHKSHNFIRPAKADRIQQYRTVKHSHMFGNQVLKKTSKQAKYNK